MAWSKESRHARGYGSAWTKLRLEILKRDGYLCQCGECKASGRITPANEVHHIKPKAKGGTDHPSNLASINSECHKRETLAEQGKARRQEIGLDGYPV